MPNSDAELPKENHVEAELGNVDISEYIYFLNKKLKTLNFKSHV
jgi:hypothetical protein